jgi:hypothetical protein
MAALEASFGDDNPLPPPSFARRGLAKSNYPSTTVDFSLTPLSDPMRACKCPALASSKEGSRGQESRRRRRSVKQEEERFR